MSCLRLARRVSRLIAAAALAMSCCHALSPRLSIRQYHHTAWSEDAGQVLPSMRAIVQTGDGYLWLATLSGHLRFDGLRFSEWPITAGALPSGFTQRLLAARDGAVWIATAAGLTRVQNGAVRDYRMNLDRRSVNTLLEDQLGRIWIAVEEPGKTVIQVVTPATGVVRRFDAQDGAPDGRVLAMAMEGSAFWIGLDRRVCRWTPGSPAACRSVPSQVVSLQRHPAGHLFVATAEAIYRLSGDRLETLATAAHASLLPGSLLLDRDGNLWAGTTGGVILIRDGAVETFTNKDGLSGDFVNGLAEDAEGDVWAATNNGVDRFRSPRFVHVSTLDGLSAQIATAVKATRDGSVWVGTYGNGLNRIYEGRITQYSIADGLPGKSVAALEEDAGGRLWISSGTKVAYFAGGRFQTVAVPPDLGPVNGLGVDAEGGVWLAGSKLFRWTGGTVETVAAGQPADIFRVFAARDGAIWLGSFNRGVFRMAGSRSSVAESIPGLKPGAPRAICEDQAGSIWIGAGSALNRVRAGRLTTWGAAHGLPEGEVYGMTADRRGNLWILTTTALIRARLAELDRSPDGSPQKARFDRYDVRDGLRPAVRAGMPTPRVTTAADGRIWLCERDGVAVLDPDLLRENSVPPPVVIEEILVDGVSLNGPAPRFQGRQLRVTYTGNSLTAPERVRFRYRLEPVDARWTDAEGRREMTFVNLAPGDYRFRVAACNLDQVCNETGATVEFRVLPFYYQTAWFKLLLIAAACAAIWGAYRLRLRRVVHRLQLVAQERARVTREIHDSLLQGFAGVVFQLDAASRQFESNPALSKEKLDRALDQADASLREARQMLLDMRLPILVDRTLSEALSEVGENATRGTRIAFHLRAKEPERPLPYAAQAALFLIGREAINNAVSHGCPARITVQILSSDKGARLVVQDDGSGFDLDAARRKAGHLGVVGMEERAKQVGAQLTIDTAPGQGTRIEVVVAGKRA